MYRTETKGNFSFRESPKADIRSGGHRAPVKEIVLKNFAIFTGKHLCWSPFLIKL